MDMNAAYQEVGSFGAAATICGTTHKTVRRAIGQGPERQRQDRLVIGVVRLHSAVLVTRRTHPSR